MSVQPVLCYRSSECNNAAVDLINRSGIDSSVREVLGSQFFENVGQINSTDIRFYGRIPGGTIGFGESKVFIWMGSTQDDIVLSFDSANAVAPVGDHEVVCRTNFFLGERGTFIDVRGYASVIYENLWSGIDLIYRATTDGVKYEFSVAPGVDPTGIRMRWEGHDPLMIRASSMCIEKDDNPFMNEGLKVFQDGAAIQAKYVSRRPQIFGIEVGDYNISESLIIDSLLFSTFVGGSQTDGGASIAVDSAGNAYVTGTTESMNFPTVNAYDNTRGGDADCFVFKLSANGDSLLYSTFVGGSFSDWGASIAVDSAGNAYVTGGTGSARSPDFPIVNAYNSTYGGNGDCFVFKLSANGDSLLYSTLVGGSEFDRGTSVAVDFVGNAYVLGETWSSDFPTVNAYDDTHGGSTDCFVFKLSASDDSLLYSTFVGGSEYDRGASIAIDSAGNTYVTGGTGSTNFPTVNAYDDTHGGGSDCFVFKLSANGDSLLYSTFVGGSSPDEGASIAVDSAGNAYVTGKTWSSDFPTVNAYDNTRRGFTDCFMFKLNSMGDDLLYSTLIGGDARDYGNSIAVDSSGNAYVTGTTESSNFPTKNAYNSTNRGGTDCFVFKLSASGDSLHSPLTSPPSMLSITRTMEGPMTVLCSSRLILTVMLMMISSPMDGRFIMGLIP
ncbi:MAG: SBBP repeat-containing protein [Candidatus Thorarchaeota archaeon]